MIIIVVLNECIEYLLCVPGTVLSTLHILSHFIHLTTPSYYFFYFTDKKNEAQRVLSSTVKM